MKSNVFWRSLALIAFVWGLCVLVKIGVALYACIQLKDGVTWENFQVFFEPY
jgi:hypothetical protein